MKKSFTFFAISALFLMLLFPVSVKADPIVKSFQFTNSAQNNDASDDNCNGGTVSGYNTVTTSDFHFSGQLYTVVKTHEYNSERWTGFASGAKACTREDVSLTAGHYTFTLRAMKTEHSNDFRVPQITVDNHTYSIDNVNWVNDNEEKNLQYEVTISTSGDYPILITCVDGDNDKFWMQKLTITPNCTQHSVTVAADDNNKGTVAGGGSYCENSEVTVTATPKPGYNFVNWTDNNNSNAVVSTNASYTFTLTANVSYRANFAACEGAAVTVNVNNGDMGSATGEGSYCAGSQVNLTATPSSGYRFVNWTVPSGSASIDNVNAASTHFTMSNPAAAVTVRANFEEDIKADRTYTYRAVEDNTGHNTNAGESTDEYLFIGAEGQYIDFTHYSAEATTCTIKVGFYAPWEGKEFKVLVNDGQERKDWTWNTTEGEKDMGEFNLSAGYNKITVAASWNWYGIRYIKVIVNESKYTVTVVNNDTYGTVTTASSNFAGEVVNISVDAKPGYFFSGWASDDVTFAKESAESTTFTMPAHSVTITTAYTTCTQRAVTVVADDDEHGSVDGGGDYCEGASVTVTATPKSGYRFENWTNTSSAVVSTDAEYTFTLLGDISLTANFVVETRTSSLTIQCEDYVHYYAKPTGSSYDYPSAITKNDYSEGRGPAQAGYFADFQESSGEMWIPISLPAGTYTFTLRYSNVYSDATRFNLYSVSSEASVLTSNVPNQDGNAYGEHTTDSYTVSTAGEFVIGLYASGTYADFDQIVINATSNVFYPRYAITLAHGYGGSNYPLANVLLAEEGQTVTLTTAAAKSEFSFTGWSASPLVEFADASAASTTFTMPAEAVTITANYNTYSRTGAPIAAGNYGTICLPLNGTVTGATLYSVAGKETGDINYLVLEDKGTSLEAGKPYIFQLSADVLSVALSGTYTDVQDGNGLEGTYVTINPLPPYNESGPYNYVLNENAFKKAGTGVTVGAYRAYLDWDAVSAPAPAPSARRIRMAIEGTEVETGMETVTAMPKTTKVLIDGQLFIIREGKRYTITGARAQ